MVDSNMHVPVRKRFSEKRIEGRLPLRVVARLTYAEGSIFVSDVGHGKITKIAADGTLLTEWGEPVIAPDELFVPVDVVNSTAVLPDRATRMAHPTAQGVAN